MYVNIFLPYVDTSRCTSSCPSMAPLHKTAHCNARLANSSVQPRPEKRPAGGEETRSPRPTMTRKSVASISEAERRESIREETRERENEEKERREGIPCLNMIWQNKFVHSKV